TQFSVVVDFAVADEPDRTVGGRERLPAALQIDDGESAKAERCVLIVLDRLVIRPAMRERCQHAPDASNLLRARREDSRDSTHLSARLPARGYLLVFVHSSRARRRYGLVAWSGR